MRKFLIIGHRGAAGTMPENTLASFNKAIALGVDMVELDVQRCKTGELVVLHDDNVRRTTNCKGFVREMTLEQVQQCRIGFRGDTIPTLEEVFKLVNRRVAINIELKMLGTALLAGELVTRYVNEYGWSYEDVVISSFQHKELAVLKEAYPYIRRAPVFERVPQSFAPIIKLLSPYAVVLNYRTVTPAIMDEVHNAGVGVYVWTVNKEKQIRKMIALGVDGIISDYPERLKGVRC
jgi:glycerophosphoryl diester phosphodiesterase